MPSHADGYLAIVGPGAIGGSLAADLLRAGRPILLLAAAPAKTEALRRRGLAVIGLDGRRRVLKDWLAPRDAARRSCDALFFCVKAAALRPAIAAARKFASPGTAVIAMQNGLDHPAAFKRAFGPRRAVLASCYVAALREPSGAVRRTGGGGVFLARNAQNARALKTARKLFRLAGWAPKTVDCEERMLWTKNVYNAAVNPIGALTRKTNAQLASIPALRELVAQAVGEGARIARGAGFPLLDADPVARVLKGCRAAPGQYNSMVQDVAAGRRTEADAILKPLLAEAARQGRKTLYLEALYRMIKALEKAP